MNRIYLDKLCEFSATTYKNYQVGKDKDWNLIEQIETIKQNLSLNEKGIVNKFNYVDLNWILPNIDYNELVLLYPLCFNVVEHYEWNYLLNSMLIILNDEYLYKSNVNKKVIIDTFDKTYKKKITIGENLSDEQIEKIAKLTNITLIILSFDNNNIYNKKENNEQKYVILYKHENEYYPVINWNTKYFKYYDYFIKYLIDYIHQNKNKSKTIQNSEKENNINQSNIPESTNLESKPKIKKSKSNVSIQENVQENYPKKFETNNLNNSNNSSDKPNEFYEEVINNNENYALYISEAIDPKDILSSTSKKNDNDVKKKTKKNSKDIFVTNKDIGKQEENLENVDKKSKKVKEIRVDKEIDENKEVKETKQVGVIKEVVVEDSVFNQTEKITKKDIIQIKNSLKPSLTLGDLQAIALKLSINIIEGSTKTGKPKNKTKSDLLEEIEKYIKDFEK